MHLALQLRKVLPSCSGGGRDEGEERGYQKKRREIERQRTCDSLSESWRVRGQVFMTLPGIQRWEYYGCWEQITTTQCSVRSQQTGSFWDHRNHSHHQSEKGIAINFLPFGALGIGKPRSIVSMAHTEHKFQEKYLQIFFSLPCSPFSLRLVWGI